MNKIDNGGPAFPSASNRYNEYEHKYEPSENIEGMTMRDYFAAKAMVGLMQMISTRAHAVSASDPAGDLSIQAYAQADAMLKARKS